MDLCSTPEWGRLKIFGLDLLHENTVFSGLGFVPEMSLMTVVQTVGVVDLLVMHPSKNAAEVIFLCPTFVVTRVYVKLETCWIQRLSAGGTACDAGEWWSRHNER